jgi:methylmalonyl-CoA mutase N-terminal domain/subunit
LAYETDVTATVDPFAGSYVVEAMTDELEAEILRLMGKVEEFGGAAKAIEVGFQKNEIETSAYDYALQIDKGERTVVGVNKFAIDVEEKYEPLRVDPAIGEQQVARLQAIRDSRNNSDVTRALDSLKRAAESTENVMYPMKEALAAKASGGEVADALREVWGRYNPPDIF